MAQDELLPELAPIISSREEHNDRNSFRQFETENLFEKGKINPITVFFYSGGLLLISLIVAASAQKTGPSQKLTDSNTPAISSSTAKTVQDSNMALNTQPPNIPEAFRGVLFWPGENKKKKRPNTKMRKKKMPAVLSSELYDDYKKEEQKVKDAAKQRIEDNKRKRLEKKEKKEEEKQLRLVEKRIKKELIVEEQAKKREKIAQKKETAAKRKEETAKKKEEAEKKGWKRRKSRTKKRVKLRRNENWPEMTRSERKKRR